MAPSAANCSNTGSQNSSGDESDGGGSSIEGEGNRDNPAALLWLESLLPLPRTCCVHPAEFPLPPTMNSRILTASPDAKCSALLGYVQVYRIRSALRLPVTQYLQCNETTGYSLHLMSRHCCIGIPLELNFTVARHSPAVFSGDLLLVTDAWIVHSPTATSSHSYIEVARCHTVISAARAQLSLQIPVSPSSASSCCGSVDAITSATTASGRPSALVRVCNATIGNASKDKPDYRVQLAFVVIEHEDALSTLSWARCSSNIHLNDLKLKNVSGVGRVFYSTPSTRCTIPLGIAALSSSESTLAALYTATITACICTGLLAPIFLPIHEYLYNHLAGILLTAGLYCCFLAFV